MERLSVLIIAALVSMTSPRKRISLLFPFLFLLLITAGCGGGGRVSSKPALKTPVTASVTAANQTYDGGTKPTITACTLTGVASGDASNVKCSATAASFADANAGTAKTVTATGISLSGTAADSYVLSADTATTTANITPKALTVTGLSASDKVYEGLTAAVLNGSASLAGVVSPDVVMLGGTPVGSFSSKNVGTNAVTVSKLSLSGANAGNYTLTQPTGLTAKITPMTLTVAGLSANNKAYDGNVQDTLSGCTLNAPVIGDDVKCSATAVSFADTQVGTAKTVTATSITLGGLAAGNYWLSPLNWPTTTADITPRPVTGQVTANDKIYDGNTIATISTCNLQGVLDGEVSCVLPKPTAPKPRFADANAGTGKTVTVDGLTLGGAAAGNYQLSSTTATALATITQKLLTANVTAANKTYDGGVTATLLSCKPLPLVVVGTDTDDVTCDGGVATFASPDVITVGKITVTTSGITLSGGKASNYALSSTSATTSASISKATATVTVTCGQVAYTGTPYYTCPAQATGVGSQDVSSSGTFTWAPPAGATTLGPHKMTATFKGSPNYKDGASAFDTLTITAFTINPFSLNATVGSNYSVTLSASGNGSYSWILAGGLPNEITLAGNVLSGTPKSSGNYSFTITARDGTNAVLQDYTLVVVNQATYHRVDGVVSSVACCNQGVGNVTVSIDTTPPITLTTDGIGVYSLQNVPDRTEPYTVTPTITIDGGSAIFYPASQTVSGTSAATNINFQAALGYPVSGSVTNSSGKTGRIYLSLQSTNGSNGSTQGTSISAVGEFTIHGVPPGSYTLKAWMDNLGTGTPNASNPAGSTDVRVDSFSVTGAGVDLALPKAADLTKPPSIRGVSAFDQGAVIQYGAIQSQYGLEQPMSYKLQWSTANDFSVSPTTKIFPANGTKTTLWLLHDLNNTDKLYFRVQGVAGATTSDWASTTDPLTIGASAGDNPISGKVNFTGSANGPMYVGFYDLGNGSIFAVPYPTPSANQQTYSVQVPNGNNYFFFGIIDQNNNGVVDVGDIANTDQGGEGAPFVIAGSLDNQNLTLNSATTAAVKINRSRNSWGNDNYNLDFDVRGLTKLPVAIALVAGPNVLLPTDVGGCMGCDNRFQYSTSLGSSEPKAGDAYNFAVTYSDSTSETVTATVGAIPDFFPVLVGPTGNYSGSTTPTFTWQGPANASDYIYEFSLWELISTGGPNIWQVPNNNNNHNNNFTLTSGTTSLTLGGVDPTGSGSTPTVTSLTSGHNYQWQIRVSDHQGNSASQSATFQQQ